jgi:hypothetical protein
MVFVWGKKGRWNAAVLAQKAQVGKRVPLSTLDPLTTVDAAFQVLTLSHIPTPMQCAHLRQCFHCLLICPHQVSHVRIDFPYTSSVAYAYTHEDRQERTILHIFAFADDRAFLEATHCCAALLKTV